MKRPAGRLKHPVGRLKHLAGRLKHSAGRLDYKRNWIVPISRGRTAMYITMFMPCNTQCSCRVILKR